MRVITVSTTVDVDVDVTASDLDDDDLIDELTTRNLQLSNVDFDAVRDAYYNRSAEDFKLFMRDVYEDATGKLLP